MCPSLYPSCSCAFLCLSSACGWVLFPSAALLAVGLLLVVPWEVVGFSYPSPSLALVGCRGLFPLRGLLGSLGLFGFVILGLWSPVAFDVARGLPCAIFVRCSLWDSSRSKLYIGKNHEKCHPRVAGNMVMNHDALGYPILKQTQIGDFANQKIGFATHIYIYYHISIYIYKEHMGFVVNL